MTGGGVRIATLVQLKYRSSRYETATKSFEFSRAAMKERWRKWLKERQKIVVGSEPRVGQLPQSQKRRASLTCITVW